jgi:hypothetical protein
MLETTADRRWTEAFTSASDFCTEILLPCSFLDTLKEEVNDRKIVHLIIEVEPSLTAPWNCHYKKRDGDTELSIDQEPTLGDPPGFEMHKQLSDASVAFSEEPVVSLPSSQSTCFILSSWIDYYVPGLPAPKRPHRNSSPSNDAASDRRFKRPRLEQLDHSDTIYKLKVELEDVCFAEFIFALVIKIAPS